jgi:hypothetical protein
MADVEVCSVGPGYIALTVKREPLDQTNLKGGVDTILGGSGGSFWKMTDRWVPRGLGGTMVGSIGST